MQYFNKSNNEINFIKDKLRSEYIPTVRLFNSNYNIQPESSNTGSRLGVTENLISNQNNYNYFNGETIILNNTIQRCGKDDSGIVKNYFVDRYEFGKFYPNLTTNYISNKDFYDTELHEYLGRYLRAYRDFYRIDVMNFYNCFSNRFISSYSLPVGVFNPPYMLRPTDSSQQPILAGFNESGMFRDNEKLQLSISVGKYDSNYKVIAFPILFDTEYRVKFYTDYVGKVEYQAVWFNGEYPLGAVEVREGENSSETMNFEPITHTESVNSVFTLKIGSKNAVEYSDGKPVLGNQLQNALSKQKLLYLFLKFSSQIDCPIVVLEEPKFTYAINNELENLPITEHEQVAYSDVLLEYLTGAVISPADTVHKNVHRIQRKIIQKNFLNKYGVGGPNYVGVDIANYKFANGVFDEGMHQIIYKAFFNLGEPFTVGWQPVSNPGSGNEKEEKSNISYKPIYKIKQGPPIPNFIGYVDKNVEDLIMSVEDDSLDNI